MATTFDTTLARRHYSYRVTGRSDPTDTPIFFVSGAFQSMRSWARFESFFGEARTVILADLPGTGDSAPLPESYGIDFLVDALERILEERGVERVHLVSASYGTAIAYGFAQRCPRRVESLILAGTMKDIPAHRRVLVEEALIDLERGRMQRFADRVVECLMCADPERRIAGRSAVARLLRVSLVGMDERARQNCLTNTRRLLREPPLDLDRAPRARTLVFTGEHDPFTRPEDCRAVAAALPCAAFTTIRDADHLFHIERFKTTVRLVDRWVRHGDLRGVADILPSGEGSPA